MTAEQWTALDITRHLEAVSGHRVLPSTIRAYAQRGQMPAPAGHLGRTPWWDSDEIKAWAETRPGRGFRSDLKKP